MNRKIIVNLGSKFCTTTKSLAMILLVYFILDSSGVVSLTDFQEDVFYGLLVIYTGLMGIYSKGVILIGNINRKGLYLIINISVILLGMVYIGISI